VTGDGADLDKDGAISILEAFVYAKAEVERHYQAENELLTEHAVLDDNGDGEGTGDAGVDGADGRLASTFRIGGRVGTTSETPADSVLARLQEERSEIEARIEALRAARGAVPAERYTADMEALLVELALKTREIRAREVGGDPR
jgi:hypothetical protein